MKETFADKVIQFNLKLNFSKPLPRGISVMYPFKENPDVLVSARKFYDKYYRDNNTRKLILGINPGRLGAGSTGIPFTDPKRLEEFCHIKMHAPKTHEPSSVFVYKVIQAYGSVEKFYNDFYISSICPLGFLTHKNGKEINYNYYDNKALEAAVRPFAIAMLQKQIRFGLDRQVCFCFGMGKNFEFIRKINAEYQFFERIIPLEHPRYIMQYKSKSMESYIAKYLSAFLGLPEGQ